MSGKVSYAYNGSALLPDGWSAVSMAEVARIVAGVGFPKDLQDKHVGNIPVFKVGDISKAWQAGQRRLVTSPSYLTEEVASLIKAKIYPAGTTVFAKIGEALRLNRRAMLSCPSIVDNNVMGLIPLDGVIDHKYLFYFMQTVDLGALSRATAVPSVRKSDVQEIVVPLAPVDQQERIVAEIEKQFSRLDEAVANLKRVKANLKRYKAAVLKAAVEGKLTEEWRVEAASRRLDQRQDAAATYEPASKLLDRILAERRAKWEEAELATMEAKGKAPKNDKWKARYKVPLAPDADTLHELPEGWAWATIEQLTWLVTSGSRGWGDYYSAEGVLFIRAQDIKTDFLNVCGVVRVDIPARVEGTRSSVSFRDILITITGANVTKSALVPCLDELAYVSQHVALLKLSLPEIAPFIFNWIISPANGRKTLESWAYGAGKPGLSLEQVRSLPVAMPPLSEQHCIATEADRLLSLAREAEVQVDANLQRGERLRQSILTAAFAGRLPGLDAAKRRELEHCFDMAAEPGVGYEGAP